MQEYSISQQKSGRGAIAPWHVRFVQCCAVCLVVAGGVFANISSASAQFVADADTPIDITGAVLDVVDGRDYVIWEGDVQAVQGNSVLTAPKLVIYGVEAGKLTRIIAEGGMRYTNGSEAISGDRGVYNAADETITVTGNVVVVQGEQILAGAKLIYNTRTGSIRFTSAAKQRVRGIFFTKDSSPKP